jgi:uncharacterized membrane protein
MNSTETGKLRKSLPKENQRGLDGLIVIAGAAVERVWRDIGDLFQVINGICFWLSLAWIRCSRSSEKRVFKKAWMQLKEHRMHQQYIIVIIGWVIFHEF